jgi:hypothetical protein
MKTVEEQAADAVDEVKPELKPQMVVSDISVEDGRLVPTTLSESARIAKALIAAKCLPEHFDTVEKVLMGMQTLRQLGLPDIACLSKLAIIRGSYSLFGEGPKAVCQSEIEDYGEFWFDKDYKEICFANKNLNAEAYGSYCRVKRRGILTAVERCFTQDDAKTARLWGKQGPWKDYPRRMLQMRARSWALKDACPDKLMGIGIAEYDHDVILDAVGNVPPADQAPRLVAKFTETEGEKNA